MYLPAHFKSADAQHAADIMRGHPFASLVSTDNDGLPYVTHLPLHLHAEGEHWTLLGHVAKPNAHWRYLQARPKAVVSFLGPHAYLSPSVYPDLARVPSWNYVAVHCIVQATLVESAGAKDALLKQLIGDHEPAYARQWRDLGEEYQHKMLAGIVGFELRVLEVQCKLKVNQHRPEALGGMLRTYQAGNDNERALAEWIEKLATARA
jgi:transcriptional regulator